MRKNDTLFEHEIAHVVGPNGQTIFQPKLAQIIGAMQIELAAGALLRRLAKRHRRRPKRRNSET